VTLPVALVMVGDELLQGARIDTNGPWLAGRLRDLGARVVGLEGVPDDVAAIAAAVERAACRARAVLVTGGLGPTRDDATREGLAVAAGSELVERADALASITLVLSARGLDIDAGRRRQARVPEGGGWLPNDEGTAPGLEVTVGDAVVWALPGVPRELEAMFEAAVVPALRALGHLDVPTRVVVPLCGLPEAEVGQRLDDIAAREDLDVGFYPHDGEVEVRIAAHGEGAATRVAEAEAEVRHRLGDAAWDVGSIEEVVVRMLRARKCLVTTAESMTGGLVARMLTAVPGASDVFRGGWVTYSDAWKTERLGVDPALLETHGAVSPQVARAMADGARHRAAAGAALAVTGIAGPGDGAAPDGSPIPRGTFHVAVALAGRETAVRSRLLPFHRPIVQRRAAVEVLNLLRLELGRSNA
jgi:nicotinamide-nucleotide amidase